MKKGRLNNDIKEAHQFRLSKILEPIKDILPKEFYIAGGCFGKQVRDIDLFPVINIPFTPNLSEDRYVTLAETANALTILYKKVVIQFCKYNHLTLESLIDSFDFAHIQIGCKVVINQRQEIIIDELYCTNDYLVAISANTTYFTGSNYPLSSLIRLLKYNKRGKMSKGKSIAETLRIVTAIVDRGFTNYDDFKDQLDAVDLGLVPEDLKELEFPELQLLFESLVKAR